MIDFMHNICNRIIYTKKWPTQWTKSILIPLPKKGKLKDSANYRTISLICDTSRVMLRIVLKILSSQVEHFLAEEQACFKKGRSTAEQIFNLRVLCEKMSEHQKEIHYNFIDFKKAFDRVWQEALWKIMRKYDINKDLIAVIEALHNDSRSAVLIYTTLSALFPTTTGVRQGCLPSLYCLIGSLRKS